MSQQSFLQRHSNEVMAVAAGAAVVAVAIAYSRNSRSSVPTRNGSKVEPAESKIEPVKSKASKLEQLLSEYRDALHVSREQLIEIRDQFVNQMRVTLSGKAESSIRMLPSMVDVLPTGAEHGEFFALDMGGTNFRTVYVKLAEGENGQDDVQMDEFALGQDMHDRPAEELFNFMAEKLMAFAKRIDKTPKEGTILNVGFCFSFPMQQTALNRGKLIKWTKGFTNQGAEGSDVSVLLEEALNKLGMKAKVMSLVTDTVGTLVACRYKHKDTMVGVILGTGSNGAYLEKAENIHNAAKPLPEGSSMVINCEWGNFTCAALPFLEEDRAIDRESTNRGSQHFEKLTAGMYMGEIARRIILRLAEEGGLFGDNIPAKLRTPMTLSTPQMGKIDHDHIPGLPITAGILADAFELTQEQLTLESLQTVQEICHCIGRRAGRIKSVGVSAVMRQLQRDGPDSTPQKTVVGVDGGVFEHYKNYRAAMTEGLHDVMGKEAAAQVVFVHVADGSSLGAAYLAAAAVEKESKEVASKGQSGDAFDKGSRTGPSTPDKASGTSRHGGSTFSKADSDA